MSLSKSKQEVNSLDNLVPFLSSAPFANILLYSFCLGDRECLLISPRTPV